MFMYYLSTLSTFYFSFVLACIIHIFSATSMLVLVNFHCQCFVCEIKRLGLFINVEN
jgi:hypothetical protein